MDMSPMIDLVFLLLIFFIVTATLLKEVGLDVSRSDTPKVPPTSLM